MAITPTLAERQAFTPTATTYQALVRRSVQMVIVLGQRNTNLLQAAGWQPLITWTVTEISPNHRIITNIVREKVSR